MLAPRLRGGRTPGPVEALVVAGAADVRPETEAWRHLVRRLHLGTDVNVSVVLADDGAGRAAWASSCRHLVVVDDLREWAPARSVGSVLGERAAGKVRGGGLRFRLRRLPRPDIVVLIDGVGADHLRRLGRPGPAVVVAGDPAVIPGDVRAMADLVVSPHPVGPDAHEVVLPVGHDGTRARIDGLDTRRAARRAALGLGGGVLVVGVGAPSRADAERLCVVTADMSDGGTSRLAWVGGTAGWSPPGPLIDPDDVPLADVVVVMDDTEKAVAAARAARFSGATVVAGVEPHPDVQDWIDARIDLADPAAAPSLSAFGSLPTSVRNDRITHAWERVDVGAISLRWERLLVHLASPRERSRR